MAEVLRPCRQPGCPALVKSGRCAAHQRLSEERRGSAAERGYDARWRRRRRMWLASHPLCAHCLLDGVVKSAEEVDHVVPKSRGGRDDETNFQSLCKSCHSAKTAKESPNAD